MSLCERNSYTSVWVCAHTQRERERERERERVWETGFVIGLVWERLYFILCVCGLWCAWVCVWMCFSVWVCVPLRFGASVSYIQILTWMERWINYELKKIHFDKKVPEEMRQVLVSNKSLIEKRHWNNNLVQHGWTWWEKMTFSEVFFLMFGGLHIFKLYRVELKQPNMAPLEIYKRQLEPKHCAIASKQCWNWH